MVSLVKLNDELVQLVGLLTWIFDYVLPTKLTWAVEYQLCVLCQISCRDTLRSLKKQLPQLDSPPLEVLLAFS